MHQHPQQPADEGVVVVGFSHSAASSAALRWAVRESRRLGCRLRILHVYDADERADARLQDAGAALAESRRAVERRALNAVRALDVDVPVSVAHVEGSLEEGLLRAAGGARLLVVGEPGECRHAGLDERLRARSPCPVTSVPAAPG